VPQLLSPAEASCLFPLLVLFILVALIELGGWCRVFHMQAFGITTKEALLSELRHQLAAPTAAAAAVASV
jgi:hypothetical protein